MASYPEDGIEEEDEDMVGSVEGVSARGALEVAVIVTGQLWRFFPHSLARHVVLPNTRAGHSVTVFVFLSKGDCGGEHNSRVWASAHAQASCCSEAQEAALRVWVANEVARCGGRLASFEIGEHWEILSDIGPYRFSQWGPRDKCARIQQYVGWYRAWLAANTFEGREKRVFDVLIQQRSDMKFVGDAAPADRFSAEAVTARDCKDWGGISDKIFVVPRHLAPVWFSVVTHIYVDLEALPAFFNNEQMLARFAASKGIPIQKVDPAFLPGLDFINFTLVVADTTVEAAGGCFNKLYATSQCIPEAQKEFVEAALCL